MAQGIPKLLVDYAWYADGQGKIGQATSVKLPNFQKVMEEFTAGGMAGHINIDMGLFELMQSTVTMAEYDPQIIKLMRFRNGEERSFTFRGALAGRGVAESLVVKMTAQMSGFDPEAIERKKQNTLELTLDISTIKMERNGEVLLDIDIEGGKSIVGGVDMRAGINDALGI